MTNLEQAWNWRKRLGILNASEAIRVFHGPGEGQAELKSFAVDRFKDHYWITEWESQLTRPKQDQTLDQIIQFYSQKNAVSIVGLRRPEKGIPSESIIFYGSPPSDRIAVRENESRFWIQLQQTRHPGLFLDHEPLRKWLRKHTEGMKVLNTFAYTGSLSVAAAQGGAQQVTTLDLSQPVIQWAKENFSLNGIPESEHRFIAGDVFEWLPRMKRADEKYDCILLDPPSFSRGKKGEFSTSKDLAKLHSLTLDLLTPEGLLITSINSANISWKKYETEILMASKTRNAQFLVLKQIDLPETFPTSFGRSENRYLKGWILKRIT